MPLRLMRGLAWLLLAGVAVVTLGPIGWRPVTAAPPNVERFVAFAVMAFVFVIAYPRRLPLVIAAVVGLAIGLELLQQFEPTRHARLHDAAVKLVGGGAGIGLALAGQWICRRIFVRNGRRPERRAP